MKRKTKRILIYTLSAIVAIAILLLILPLTLSKVTDRSNPYYPDRTFQSEIKEETSGMNAEEIRSYSLKKTCSLLSFSVRNDLSDGKANCIGYAQMCASIFNYACRSNGLNSKAKPVVGYVMLYGINLCDVLKWCMPTKRWENFVKDHDFVEFNIDGQVIYADASAYDILWQDCKTSK